MNPKQKLSEKQPKIIKDLHHKKKFFFLVCMSKMSSEAERHTEERKITVKAYTKNKIHTIRVKKRGFNEFYVIQVKMIDLQKRSDYRIYVMLQLLTTFCGTKSPTKEQIKQYKGKRNELGDDGDDDDDDDDDKSVYLNEDFAYKLIRYIDPGVTEANKFRKNLGVENNKSI